MAGISSVQFLWNRVTSSQGAHLVDKLHSQLFLPDDLVQTLKKDYRGYLVLPRPPILYGQCPGNSYRRFMLVAISPSWSWRLLLVEMTCQIYFDIQRFKYVGLHIQKNFTWRGGLWCMGADFPPLQFHAASQLPQLAWCWPHLSPCYPWSHPLIIPQYYHTYMQYNCNPDPDSAGIFDSWNFEQTL